MKVNEAATLVALNLADIRDTKRLQPRRSHIDRLVDAQPDHDRPECSRSRILIRFRMQPDREGSRFDRSPVIAVVAAYLQPKNLLIELQRERNGPHKYRHI